MSRGLNRTIVFVATMSIVPRIGSPTRACPSTAMEPDSEPLPGLSSSSAVTSWSGWLDEPPASRPPLIASNGDGA